jgi:hypothetical protein
MNAPRCFFVDQREMALVRQKETEWNFLQPPAPFPKCPGANGCFLSPSGGGKTTTLVSMLMGPYKSIYSEIHVFSPSVFLDSAWDVIVKHAKTLDTGDCKSTFHDSWDEPALLEIMAKQRKKIQDLKLTKTKKNLPQLLIVLDDLADSGVIHQCTRYLLHQGAAPGSEYLAQCPEAQHDPPRRSHQFCVHPLLGAAKPKGALRRHSVRTVKHPQRRFTSRNI